MIWKPVYIPGARGGLFPQNPTKKTFNKGWKLTVCFRLRLANKVGAESWFTFHPSGSAQQSRPGDAWGAEAEMTLDGWSTVRGRVWVKKAEGCSDALVTGIASCQATN